MKTTSKVNLKNPLQKTIAIIQITRFGDLIQTAQSVMELKKSHPDYRLVLIARSQFSRPLNFLLKKHFDYIYNIDTKTMFNDSETKGLSHSLGHLNLFLEEIKMESIDVLINLSFSKPSCYLTTLINSRYKIGPAFDLSNKLVINDKWSQMLYSTVMRGSYNPYNLVDLFKNIIGIKESNIKPRHLSIVKEEKKKNIIIHPFASQERKIWKGEKWVEVVYKTLKDNEHHTVTIVGAKNEVFKSQVITESPLLKPFGNRLINLTGKTTLEELYIEVQDSILFVGHDSMVGHLAGFTNTTSLTISLGNVRPTETTPYNANAYNISPKTKCFPCFPSDNCAFYQCHHDIPYQIVSSSIKELITNKELTLEWSKKSLSSFHLSSVNIYRSQLLDGKQRLNSIVDSYQDTTEVFKTLYRIAWSYLISEQEEVFAFPKLSPINHQEMLNAMSGLQHLFELSDFGKRYSRYILEEISSQTPSVNKIKEYSKKIDEIDNLQKMVQKTSPQLAPIIDYFTIRKANLFGGNIVELTESSHAVFNECGDFCRIVYELIENSISEFKNTNKATSARTDNNK